MWIVRLALRRPYTFVVLALLIAVLGILSIVSMPTDIFPRINIPVVTVIWSYSGLSPIEMQNRIVTVTERAFTSSVNGIEHLESVSLRGVAVTRLYFHPNVPIAAAIAEVNAQAQGDPAPTAAGHLSAADPAVHCRQRSGSAGELEQRSTPRAGAE